MWCPVNVTLSSLARFRRLADRSPLFRVRSTSPGFPCRSAAGGAMWAGIRGRSMRRSMDVALCCLPGLSWISRCAPLPSLLSIYRDNT